MRCGIGPTVLQSRSRLKECAALSLTSRVGIRPMIRANREIGECVVSYVNSVLQPGETVKAVGRMHWIIFLRAIFFAAVALAIFVYTRRLQTPNARELGLLCAGLALAVA